MLNLLWLTVQLTFWLIVMLGIAITAAAGMLALPAAGTVWIYRKARGRHGEPVPSPTKRAA